MIPLVHSIFCGVSRRFAEWRERFPSLRALRVGRLAGRLETLAGGPFPTTVQIETNVSCTLRCPECALGGGLIQRRGTLTLDPFRILADRVRPYCRFLCLMLWGEPLLNPDLVRMLRYASTFCKCSTSTNALAMTEELADDLVTSGISRIMVSIDGATQETYEKYRVGGDLEKAWTGLRMLADANARRGGRVRIQPQFLVFEHNRHEMDAFRARCAGLGLEPAFRAPYVRGRSEIRCGTARIRPDMRDCNSVRRTLTVLVDGSVVPCSYDHDGELRFGNLFRQDVHEIWNRPAYRRFRHDVIAGHAPEFCRRHCLFYQA